MAASHTDSHPARTELASISLDDLIVAIRAGGVDAQLAEGRTAAGGVNARLAASGTTEQAAVRGMTVDSREVQPGNLFVCKGAAFRPAFLASAIEHGACAYLCPNNSALLEQLELVAPGAPHIVASDVRRAMALVAPVVYQHPEQALDIVGITGTKGKSTVAYMLRSILLAAGETPSVLGSIETDDGIEHYESHNTTPEAPELWRHLWNSVKSGRRHMVMEVSSQGLKYGRVLGVPLSIGVFLNIGRDHISGVEHPTFEDYFASKLRIFDQCETAVVNIDAEHAARVLSAAKKARRLVTTSAQGADDATFAALNAQSTGLELTFEVVDRLDPAHPQTHAIALGMAGLFNVDNALAAIACARLLGVGYDAISRGLAHVRVPGRMEIVATPDQHVIAIVDYAHTPDALENVIQTIEEIRTPEQQLIVVCGCGGDRDKTKRPEMAAIAVKYATTAVFTSDNPRHESPEAILDDMAAGIEPGARYLRIADRAEAIRTAVMLSRPGDIILVAGKGHETYQVVGDVKHHFDDREEVRKAFDTLIK